MCQKHNYEILKEVSLSTLANNTQSALSPPRKENSDKVQLSPVKVIAYPSDGALEFTCTSRSSGKRYKTSIRVEGISFVDEDYNASPTKQVTAIDGTVYYVTNFSTRNETKVRCQCLDFYFMFSIWNKAQGALLGKAHKRYIKVPGSNYPPRNPSKTPGMCKHLLKLYSTIKSSYQLQ